MYVQIKFRACLGGRAAGSEVAASLSQPRLSFLQCAMEVAFPTAVRFGTPKRRAFCEGPGAAASSLTVSGRRPGSAVEVEGKRGRGGGAKNR